MSDTLMDVLEEHLDEAALLWLKGHRAAWTACQVAVDSGAPDSRWPALLLALSGDAREVERLKCLLDQPRHRPDALWALGFSGRPSAAEACLEWMEDEAVSHLLSRDPAQGSRGSWRTWKPLRASRSRRPSRPTRCPAPTTTKCVSGCSISAANWSAILRLRTKKRAS